MTTILYTVAFGLATVLSVTVTWRAIQAYPRQGAQWMAVAMAGVAWWSLMKFAETLFVGQEPIQLLFSALHWVGVGGVSVGVLGFGLSLTGRDNWLTPVRIAVLSAVTLLPVLAWLGDPRVVELLLTHGVMPRPVGSAMEVFESTWSWLRWVSLLYLWSLVALGSVFVLETALERPKLDPNRGLLGVMIAVPWVVNLSYEFGLITNVDFDPTVFGFVVTGIAGIAAIDRFRLFDVPFARSQIVEQLDTPILTYGPDHRLYDYNERAAALLELTPEDLGTDIREVFTESALTTENQAVDCAEDLATSLNNTRISIPCGDGDDQRTFLVQLSEIGDREARERSYAVQLTDITDQYRQRMRVRRERDLKEIIRSILVQLSSRRDIERAFCERLADDERYTAVWIGEYSASGNLVVRTYAGRDDEEVTPDGGNNTDLPTTTARKALETGEFTTGREPSHGDLTDDGDHSPDPEMESIAGLPLTYNELNYGVLVVSTARQDAFSSEDQRLLTELSESIAFAINAVEQREALHGETVREMVIQIQDPSHYLVSLANSSPAVGTDATISVYEIGSASRADTLSDDAVGDDSRLQFVTASGVSADPIVDSITSHDAVQSVTVLTDNDETVLLRVNIRPPTLSSRLAAAGGIVQTVNITGKAVEAVAEFSPRTEMQRTLEYVRDVYPSASLVSLVTKESTAVQTEQSALDSLTEKQREALEFAYHSGFFERPQRQTAEEIAHELGVSRSTFLSHVRAAENKLLKAFLTQSYHDQTEVVE